MRLGDHDGSSGVERRLHAMRGDARRAPDLSEAILSRISASRPFADRRTLRLRRWGRVVGMSFGGGLAVCLALVAVQWPLIAPGGGPVSPVQGVVSGAAADLRAGNLTLRGVPARLTQLSLAGQSRTDPEDSKVVRSMTSNVIVPLGSALSVTPSLEPAGSDLDLTARLLQRGQRVLNAAEKLASAFKPSAGVGGPTGSETFTDRLGRAVGGAPVIDGGPQ